MRYFDTYAIIEILNGSEAYESYMNEPIITSVFNIAELYHCAFRQEDSTMIAWIELLKPDLIEVETDVIRNAMRFRSIHKKSGFSMTDCIGYAIAQKQGMPFLTGDKEFKDFPGVEYVK